MTKEIIKIPDCLISLPQNLTKITSKQRCAWIDWESKNFNLKQLRERQHVVNFQITEAHKKENTKALNNLKIHEDILTQAVYKKCFS